MNEAEYEEFVQAAYDGHVVVGVDRVDAKKLYTEVSLADIEKATGETVYLEKLVVRSAELVSFVAAIGSVGLAALAFGWWAVLITPVALFLWFFNISLSVVGGSRIWVLTLLLIAAVVVHLMKLLPSPWMSGFFAVYFLALWCSRLLYSASTVFLRAFVLRNQRALDAFADGITIRTGPDG